MSLTDHDRTVGTARRELPRFDQDPVLFRWIRNYADRKDIVLHRRHIHIVVRDGKRWRVDVQRLEDPADWRIAFFHVDGRAPAPPVFEWRPPAPEPVRPRFRVPKAPEVPSFDTLLEASSSRIIDRAYREMLLGGQAIVAMPAPASDLSLTLDKLHAAIASVTDISQFLRGPEEIESLVRARDRAARWTPPPEILMEFDYADNRMKWWTRSYGATPIRSSEAIVRLETDGPAAEPMKRPPPAPSRRN